MRSSSGVTLHGPHACLVYPSTLSHSTFLPMDSIPAATHAAEVAATIDDLQEGLGQIALSKAVNRIDTWERELRETERDDLQPIADDLQQLHGLLTGGNLDGRAIGQLLVRLGSATEEVADQAEEVLQSKLKRLGGLLRHSGHALDGNS